MASYCPKGDLYLLLGCSQTATTPELKLAWRAKIKNAHPDLTGNGGHAHAAELNNAYDVLSDPVKRAEYDAERQRYWASLFRPVQPPTPPAPPKPTGQGVFATLFEDQIKEQVAQNRWGEAAVSTLVAGFADMALKQMLLEMFGTRKSAPRPRARPTKHCRRRRR